MKTTAATNDPRSTDWGHYGVNPVALPTVSAYPKAFSKKPDAVAVWKEVLDSQLYADRLLAVPRVDTAPRVMWSYAIKRFLRLCNERDVYAFDGIDNHTEVATNYLRTARQKLVDFLHSSKVFEKMSISSVERNFTSSASGFTIMVTARLKPIEDPTVGEWLIGQPVPGFKRHNDGWLRKSVHTSIDLEYHPTSLGGCLVYRIQCNTPLRISGLPSASSLRRHMEERLWLPICREFPVESTGTRSHF